MCGYFFTCLTDRLPFFALCIYSLFQDEKVTRCGCKILRGFLSNVTECNNAVPPLLIRAVYVTLIISVGYGFYRFVFCYAERIGKLPGDKPFAVA